MKIKKPIILFIIIVTTIFINSVRGNKMSILQDQPVFKLNINTYGTKHIVNINGVSILKDLDEEGQSETNMPINHLMRSGTNTIELYILPNNPGEQINNNARASITLNISDNRNLDNSYTLTNIDFQAALLNTNNPTSNSLRSGTFDSKNNFASDTNGDVEVFNIINHEVNGYAGAIKLVREIHVTSSLPLWAFFNSDDLPDYDSLSDNDYYRELDALLSEYMKIQNAIKAKNIKSILHMFSERNTELDTAFYQQPGTYERKIFESLNEAANDEGLELVDLKRDFVNIKTEDNNKLASLNRAGFKAAIALNFKQGNGTQRYPLIFRLENKKWILTR